MSTNKDYRVVAAFILGASVWALIGAAYPQPQGRYHAFASREGVVVCDSATGELRLADSSVAYGVPFNAITNMGEFGPHSRR